MVEVGASAKPELLQGKQPLHSRQLGFAELLGLIQSAFLTSAFVEKHVVIAGTSAHDLPGTRDFKSLRRCLVCLQLWHLSFGSRRLTWG